MTPWVTKIFTLHRPNISISQVKNQKNFIFQNDHFPLKKHCSYTGIFFIKRGFLGELTHPFHDPNISIFLIKTQNSSHQKCLLPVIPDIIPKYFILDLNAKEQKKLKNPKNNI